MTRRTVPVLLVAVAAAVGYVVLSGDDDRYLVKVELSNAGGLRKGANVRVAGAPAGSVAELRLDDRDRAVADLRLEPEVAPVGAGAKAVVDTDGFFGERFVEIARGDLRRPRPSGTVIRQDRSSVSTRLDDVVDALDVDTRDALKAFLNEQGAAVVGRGRDLAKVLAALPPSLDRTGELLDQFAADNRALGRLIESGDRVVGEVAAERRDFGRLMTGFAQTLDVLDGRRAELGETFRRAPGALRSARATLTSLEAAAGPLVPAARGLRTTAPGLTRTLAELPRFTKQAVPALDTIARVSPALERLGANATPIVRDLRPLASELSDYTQRALGPFSRLLDTAGTDVLGTMEGWARSTQGRDAASHIFRFGATSGSDTLATLLQPPSRQRGKKRSRVTKRDRPRAGLPRPAAPDRPGLPKLPALPKVPALPDEVDRLVDQAPQAVQQAAESAGQAPTDGEELLDFLLRP